MKTLISAFALVLSLSAQAQIFQCKSINSEYVDVDVTIAIEEEEAQVYDNKTNSADVCMKSYMQGINVTAIFCDGAYIAIPDSTDKKGTYMSPATGYGADLECEALQK